MKHLQTSAGFIFITLSDKMLNFRRCSDYRKKVKILSVSFLTYLKVKFMDEKIPTWKIKLGKNLLKAFYRLFRKKGKMRETF